MKPLATLSISSRKMLIWAAALARHRTAKQGKSTVFIEDFDLFASIMLEHPERSEASVLLEHLNLLPAQILPDDYIIPSAGELDIQLRTVSEDNLPELDPTASSILANAETIGSSSGNSAWVELRAVFYSLLDTSGNFQSRLMEILEGYSLEWSQLISVTNTYLQNYKTEEEYASLLQEHIPYDANPIDIPNYKADHKKLHDLSDDLIGIRAEVDAFAYLLASRGLKPPLAVGLFGEWGSGKTFFMQSVRNRIESLTNNPKIKDKPQAEVPYWKRIIHIEFNAWHYIEGNLWASLVNHIFNQLKLKGEDEDIVQKRREHWLKKLDDTRVEYIELKADYDEKERELHSSIMKTETLQRKRDLELQNLQSCKAQRTSGLLIKKSFDEVKAALEPHLVTLGLPESDDILKKLNNTKANLKGTGVLFDSLWNNKNRVYRIAIIASVLLVPLVIWGMSHCEIPPKNTIFTGIFGSLTSFMILFSKANSIVRDRLNILNSAQLKVEEEIAMAKGEIEKKVNLAKVNADKAEQDLNEVIEEKNTLIESIKDIKDQLEQTTPARVLNDFVEERVGSNDYRKHLGVPAIIQRDFEQLADLVSRQNEDIVNSKNSDAENNELNFNRIVLYIDDLDRCPDNHVVEVLQAVHLLLAFELFVVVVAVDSRWLSHALINNFKALAPENSASKKASPDDYLEKIFQIPFWVEPLNDYAKQNIINGLLEGHLVAGETDGTPRDDDLKIELGNAQKDILNLLCIQGNMPTMELAALSIEAKELTFLEELTSLLGATPRSTKRFVNLYQLVRIIYRQKPNEDEQQPGKYEMLAFMLAIGENFPALSAAIRNEKIEEGSALTFQDLHSRLNLLPGHQKAKLDNWLRLRGEWNLIPLSRIKMAYLNVERFLFRVGDSSKRISDERQTS